jgi:hypothetical protein
MSWQPIETAPKDGSFMLLAAKTCLRPQPLPFTGRWLHGVPGCWVLVNADLAVQRIDPSHWMPLPESPKEKE